MQFSLLPLSSSTLFQSKHFFRTRRFLFSFLLQHVKKLLLIKNFTRLSYCIFEMVKGKTVKKSGKKWKNKNKKKNIRLKSWKKGAPKFLRIAIKTLDFFPQIKKMKRKWNVSLNFFFFSIRIRYTDAIKIFS